MHRARAARALSRYGHVHARMDTPHRACTYRALTHTLALTHAHAHPRPRAHPPIRSSAHPPIRPAHLRWARGRPAAEVRARLGSERKAREKAESVGTVLGNAVRKTKVKKKDAQMRIRMWIQYRHAWVLPTARLLWHVGRYGSTRTGDACCHAWTRDGTGGRGPDARVARSFVRVALIG